MDKAGSAEAAKLVPSSSENDSRKRRRKWDVGDPVAAAAAPEGAPPAQASLPAPGAPASNAVADHQASIAAAAAAAAVAAAAARPASAVTFSAPLSLDQKKAMLWGKKGASQPAEPTVATVEETFGANRWDAAGFNTESERSKFLRLMGGGKAAAAVPPPPAAAAQGAAKGSGNHVAMDKREEARLLAELEAEYVASRSHHGRAGLGAGGGTFVTRSSAPAIVPAKQPPAGPNAGGGRGGEAAS